MGFEVRGGGSNIGEKLHIVFNFVCFQDLIHHVYEGREMRRVGCSRIFDDEL